MAVSCGEIRKLIINIPPRHMKSLAVCVFWPAWEWGPRNNPQIRWLFASYADQLAKRDSLKTRALLTSPWYQQRWGKRFKIRHDQNEKMRFENEETGYRVATTVGGMGTGEGGDHVVVDDPHNVKDGESELKRLAALLWWDETIPTRVNNPHTSTKTVVMQRIHEDDLSGHILAAERGYVHLCLPARYEGSNRVKTCLPLDSPVKFKDPRTEMDEPLWPALYNNEALANLESEMSSYAVAGQLQQTPHPRGGGIFEVDKFKLIPELPHLNRLVRAVRYWDKAGTEDDGDYSAGVLMFMTSDGRFIIADMVRGQWSYPKRENRIEQTAALDNAFFITKTWTEQEPGSGGKESAERTVKNLLSLGHPADMDRVTGDKVTRAEPYSAAIEHGKVDILIRPWTDGFIKEHEKAPTGKYKDQWDSAAGAYNKLASKRKEAGVW